MEIFADLTFWQMVGVALVALPVLAIILVVSGGIVLFVLWWTIKLAFLGALLLIVIMGAVFIARMFGAA